jgi:SM-20-related protein
MVKFKARDDVLVHARTFKEHGYVHIPDFIDASDATLLYEQLRQQTDWRQVLTTTSGFVELDRATRSGMAPDTATALDNAVYAQARADFQYRFETVRVPDSAAERAASTDTMCDFARMMSSGDARDFLRGVTGAEDVQYADAQATAYSPGDFLTGHDDAVAGKSRRAAYVFGLTPIWRLEWGGLLLFHGSDGHVERGLVPTFNSLNLFAVPRIHSVSEVTRAAAYRRYAITGWLRAETQPV